MPNPLDLEAAKNEILNEANFRWTKGISTWSEAASAIFDRALELAAQHGVGPDVEKAYERGYERGRRDASAEVLDRSFVEKTDSGFSFDVYNGVVPSKRAARGRVR